MTEEVIGRYVEICGCGENTGKPYDEDGDGIAEKCRICGEYYSLQWRHPNEVSE